MKSSAQAVVLGKSSLHLSNHNLEIGNPNLEREPRNSTREKAARARRPHAAHPTEPTDRPPSFAAHNLSTLRSIVVISVTTRFIVDEVD